MTDEEAAFVAALAQHLYGRGMPRMPARVWAWLLICDPPDQTADDLVESLHSSRGAISGAAGYLATLGLIRRGRRRAERRERFSVPPGGVRRLIARMGTVLTQGREVADEGLALMAGRPPATRVRLEEFRDVYAYYEREWPAVVDRYLQGRAGLDGATRTLDEAAASAADTPTASRAQIDAYRLEKNA